MEGLEKLLVWKVRWTGAVIKGMEMEMEREVGGEAWVDVLLGGMRGGVWLCR